MNKEGTIILLDIDEEHCTALCKGIAASGHKNNCLGFTNAAEAAAYLRDNVTDVFILLQSTGTPRVEIANTRNMVYLHEKFDTDKLPYMLLMLTQATPETTTPHTFIHCYYNPDTAESITKTLSQVVFFWKDQVFPPKVRPFL